MDATKRLLSLDIFRGLTIAAMILVNNPGSWATVYPPLLHAEWHGCTPTDLIFPFFLFIVGVAVAFALGKRMEAGVSTASLSQKIGRRVLIIFGLGLFLAAFPKFGIKDTSSPLALAHYVLLGISMLSIFLRECYPSKGEQADRNKRIRRALAIVALLAIAGMIAIGVYIYDFSSLRIPGVLQRIAIVYGVCALLFINSSWKGQLYFGIGCLLAYWGLMTLVPVPGVGPPSLEAESNLGAWLDRLILGNHLWAQSKTWDPEGILSTIPAIATGIVGMLTGEWLRSKQDEYKKLTGILGMGAILIALALIWDLFFPINKQIWTSSYVLYSGGIAMLFLGVTYWLVDVLKYKGWTMSFEVYGKNALFVFVASGVVAKILYNIRWELGNGHQTLQNWIYDNFFTPVFSPYNASLAYAILMVLLFLGFSWILYLRKIFIKV